MEYVQIDEKNKETILELFDKKVDTKGFIVEKKTGKRIKCPYSKRLINIINFSIIPGTATFVNNEPYCFSEHIAKHS